nr:bifunctional phosphoribosyl-AMP cyclohydrolase/phosphoribosyl-ATP diphosphatase HisIE [Paenibacillus turpanensis]
MLSAIKWDANGLVPAIVQDASSKEVLMMAYMNEESLKKSAESGETWFYSRSRQELWHKGATSGNTQQITDLRYDCDGDTLLVLVKANGPACHTGERTCFYRSAAQPAEGQEAAQASGGKYDIFDSLEQTIAQRDEERPEGAYTTYLFEKGVDKILKKVGEEAAEVIIAAKNRSKDELRYEASDLLFHLLVLLREQGLPFEDVLQELARRHKK